MMTVSGTWGWTLWSARAFFALVVFLVLAWARIARAQAPDGGPADSVTVVVGHEYAKPGIHEFFFGSDYRKLWDTAIRVPVLNLATEGGGLKPVRRVGGLQTRALAIAGADGRSYTFRGLEKDVSGLLDAELEGTIVEDLLKDQMAAQHPASELVASEITRAAGIHTQQWRLVVLPNDPALGEFQKEFAGAVGTFGEFPTGPATDRPGTYGLTEVIDYKELYKRLEQGTARVDAHEVLRARLVDIMMGDWDRHRRQWRWARFPENTLYHPIVEDRDQAFSRYQGVMLDFARMRDSRFQNFEEDYGSIEGLTWNGRDQDRYLLTELDVAAYDSAAATVQARVTDAVLERAVGQMPPPWLAIDGGRLLRDLKQRRDDLGKVARTYYRHLAGKVDVEMTHLPERVDAVRRANGDLEVSIRATGPLPSGQVATDPGVPAADPGQPYYRRVFLARDTDEVRFYGRSGDDVFHVTGPGGGIRVRAIGELGNDSLIAAGSGPAKLSDDEGRNVAKGAAYDEKKYVEPPRSEHSPWIRHRDWGSKTFQAPWINYSADLGFFFGWMIDRTSYSFRKYPYSQSHKIRAGYALGAMSGKFEYDGTYRRENRSSYWGLNAFASGVEVLRFYGLGNETPNIEDTDFTRVRAVQYRLRPAFTIPFGRRGGELSFGPIAVFNKLRPQEDVDSSLIELTSPYGAGDFGQAGAFAELDIDQRDHPIFTRRGWRIVGGGAAYPELWDVEKAFGQVNGAASWYVSAGTAVTLALRGGGKRVFGTYPFQEAATIGGGTLGEIAIGEPDYTVRGFRAQRFRGDGSLWGNAEARLSLGHVQIILPARIGVLGFSDAGRVWLDGEDSETWHTGVGGGLWLSFLRDAGVGTVVYAHSEEGDRIYLKGGFTF